jgi:4-hydroxybenzoate polyprenyltransferase
MVVAESRPPVQVLFLLRLVAFAAAAGGLGSLVGTGLLGIAGWSMLAMAVYVFNGISDVDGDRTNASSRPIASGALSTELATEAAAVLAVLGVALCALCSVRLVLLGLGALLLGGRYSAGRVPLKSTTSGVSVAGGGGVLLCYAAGAAIAGGATPVTALLFGLAEAVWQGLCVATKDFSDVEGDRQEGRRTWPIVLGERGARLLVASCSATLAVVFAALAGVTGDGLRVPAATAAVGAVAVAISVLRFPTTGDRATRRRPYRTLMVTQYAMNIALLVSAVS